MSEFLRAVALCGGVVLISILLAQSPEGRFGRWATFWRGRQGESFWRPIFIGFAVLLALGLSGTLDKLLGFSFREHFGAAFWLLFGVAFWVFMPPPPKRPWYDPWDPRPGWIQRREWEQRTGGKAE